MRKLIIAVCIIFSMPISEAHAYVGPGLGLGALGVVLGVFFSIGLAVLAVVWYPLKRVLRNFKIRSEENSALSVKVPDGGDDAK